MHQQTTGIAATKRNWLYKLQCKWCFFPKQMYEKFMLNLSHSCINVFVCLFFLTCTKFNSNSCKKKNTGNEINCWDVAQTWSTKKFLIVYSVASLSYTGLSLNKLSLLNSVVTLTVAMLWLNSSDVIQVLYSHTLSIHKWTLWGVLKHIRALWLPTCLREGFLLFSKENKIHQKSSKE